MSYEKALEAYFRRGATEQPCSGLSVWTGKGWSMRNANGYLGYVWGGNAFDVETRRAREEMEGVISLYHERFVEWRIADDV